MQSRFSIATLLLIVAIAAVGAAAIRGVVVRDWNGAGALANAGLVMLPIGFFAGGLFGLAASIWNRAGWLRGFAATMAGFVLGTAAGAQTLAKVDWAAIFAAPIVLVGTAALIAANRRPGKSGPTHRDAQHAV